MSFKINYQHLKFNLEVLFFLALILVGCKSSEKSKSNEINFNNPIDSIEFNYLSETLKKTNINYSENLYGDIVLKDSSNKFKYYSINSDNQLHIFDFSTNIHYYSKKICNYDIKGYMIDSSHIYLLYNDFFYIKDFNLNTLDSFKYPKPKINKKHDFDFSIENTSNIFKLKNYFVIMYYEVDNISKGQDLYKNTDKLFYFFNKDTSFFNGNNCNINDTTFQYFRYPAVASDGNYLYHAPRVMNCISKTNNISTIINSKIVTKKGNYLTCSFNDQFEISKLKKYRFSTDYNRNIITDGDYVYLFTEIPLRIYEEQNVKKYDRILKLTKYNKNLKLMKTYFIKNKNYNYPFISNNKLYIINFDLNKIFIHGI